MNPDQTKITNDQDTQNNLENNPQVNTHLLENPAVVALKNVSPLAEKTLAVSTPNEAAASEVASETDPLKPSPPDTAPESTLSTTPIPAAPIKSLEASENIPHQQTGTKKVALNTSINQSGGQSQSPFASDTSLQEAVAPILGSAGVRQENNSSFAARPIMRILRTFQSDTKQALETDNISLVKMARLEQERREQQLRNAPKVVMEKAGLKKPFPWALAASIALGMTVLGALGGGIWLYGSQLFKPAVRLDPTILISFIPLDFNRDVFLQEPNRKNLLLQNDITRERTELSLHAIAGINLLVASSTDKAGEAILTPGLFNILETRAPAPLIRALNERYLFGYHRTARDNAPFILFKVNSYANAFEGMLDWERDMGEDLSGFIWQPTTEFWADSSTFSRHVNSFEDVIINNQDVRAIKDPNGEIVLLYTFLTKDYLLLTTNEFTEEAIFGRLINTRTR